MIVDKLTISVNVCTFNEEKNIEECIRCIEKNNPIEIIIIDGGSTDKTIQIAKNLGAKVIKSKKGLALSTAVKNSPFSAV